MRLVAFFLPLPFTLAAFGCSAGDSTDGTTTPGTGGDIAGTGGETTSGGSTSTGGTQTGGASGTGGAVATGGSTQTGGSGGGESCTPSSGIEDVGTDSFLDKATCLTWQKTDTFPSDSVVNRVAQKHCLDLVQDGFDDWRLPTGPELVSYPNLPAANSAYVTVVFAPNASSQEEGCTGNSHSCNIGHYNSDTYSCTFQGPGGNPYAVLCVRGTAASTLDSSYSAAVCCPQSSNYTETDCSAYP